MMTQQEILQALNRAGKPDLSIPESKRLSIPHNNLIKPYL